MELCVYCNAAKESLLKPILKSFFLNQLNTIGLSRVPQSSLLVYFLPYVIVGKLFVEKSRSTIFSKSLSQKNEAGAFWIPTRPIASTCKIPFTKITTHPHCSK